MKKRMLPLLLALAMALSLVSVPALAADGLTYSPSSAPGKVTAETVIDTGIPGLTLTVGADEWTYSAIGNIVSDSGVTYPGYIVGKANPKVASKTGTYYSFAVDPGVAAGTLEIMYRLGGGKQFFIMDNGTAMTGYDGAVIDQTANASATIIVQGGHTYTVYAQGSKLRLYGCTFKNVDPAKEFADEIAAFSFDKIKGANTDKDHVEENLNLVDSYESRFGSCDVNWDTSNAAVIANDGAVNCQKTETKVTLTGHFQVQENRKFKADGVFDVTVSADPDDASAVAKAAEALTLGDTSSVKRNLSLPTAGKRGTTITWKSSDPAVVDNDGKVYPAAQADKSATLTATIARGGESATKDFAVTVAGIVPVTLDSWSYQDASGAPRFSYAPGARLYSVNVTCNDPNPDPDDAIFVQVCAADGSIKASRDFSMKETFANIPVGKSTALYMDLPMDSGDHVEVMARNVKTGVTLVEPVRADDTVADGAVIYVVGDSTASVYGDDRYPRKGWAQLFGGYFNGVTVTDLALSGRASMSFKKEANYETLKNSLKKGDYLIVQFGHNDNKAESFTDPAGDRFTEGSYKQSMLEYVELAWEKGAKPILATSISRRKTSDASLEVYVKAAKELAAELSIPCIDLYARTNGWINEVGVENAKDMFNYVKKDDPRFMGYANFKMSEFYGKDSTDDTHINIYGADLISQWAADELKALGVPVAAKLSAHRATYPLPSYATGAGTPATPPSTDFSANTSAPAANRPADLDSSKWWYPAVCAVLDSGAMKGTDLGFEPDKNVTTASVYQTIYNMEGSPAPAGSKTVSVPDGAWYAAALNWAANAGLYDGANFADADANRGVVKNIMDAYCAQKGITVSLFKGNESGDMMLGEPLTRAQWAQVLVNFENAKKA